MRRKALRFEIMTMENTVSKLRFSRRIDFNDCRDSLQLFCDGINLDRFSKNCTSLRESESETARKARVRKTEAATATQWERSERVREEAREISQRAETPEIEWVREREIKRETQCGLSRAGTSVETWFCFKKFFFHACSQGIGEVNVSAMIVRKDAERKQKLNDNKAVWGDRNSRKRAHEHKYKQMRGCEFKVRIFVVFIEVTIFFLRVKSVCFWECLTRSCFVLRARMQECFDFQLNSLVLWLFGLSLLWFSGFRMTNDDLNSAEDTKGWGAVRKKVWWVKGIRWEDWQCHRWARCVGAVLSVSEWRWWVVKAVNEASSKERRRVRRFRCGEKSASRVRVDWDMSEMWGLSETEMREISWDACEKWVGDDYLESCFEGWLRNECECEMNQWW